jgi:hypothetical protein
MLQWYRYVPVASITTYVPSLFAGTLSGSTPPGAESHTMLWAPVESVHRKVTVTESFLNASVVSKTGVKKKL